MTRRRAESPVKSAVSRRRRKYDVIIVGGGPAGVFTALELCQAAGARVLLLEKGRDIDARKCPLQEKGERCVSCSPCHLVSGLGGAGAFSDGKLTLSSVVGGRLGELVGDDKMPELIDYVDSVYLRFGASDRVYGVGEAVDELGRRAILADLKLIPVRLRHIGTERSRQVLKAMRDFIMGGVDVRLREEATAIIVNNGVVTGVETSRGDRLECRAKLEFFSKSFDNRVRTFCMCPGGEVMMEATGGADPVITVNGSSYADRKTGNTNFAILVSTAFTEPFREPIAYGKYLARLANLLSGGVLVQRLGDLMEGHRSTPSRIERSVVEPTLKAATPGDLSFALPFRHLKGIVEMLEAMDKLAPGVASRHTLLYGIEVKFYSSQLELSPCLETQVGNMFAAGDGAGVSRGLVQASACGIVVAREILRRLGTHTHS